MSDVVYMPPVPGTAIDNDDRVVDATVGGVILLAANPNRRSAMILNLGTEDMRITTDGSDPTSTHGKLLSAGSALVLSSPYCPTKEIKAIRQGTINTSANASEVI